MRARHQRAAAVERERRRASARSCTGAVGRAARAEARVRRAAGQPPHDERAAAGEAGGRDAPQRRRPARRAARRPGPRRPSVSLPAVAGKLGSGAPSESKRASAGRARGPALGASTQPASTMRPSGADGHRLRVRVGAEVGHGVAAPPPNVVSSAPGAREAGDEEDVLRRRRADAAPAADERACRRAAGSRRAPRRVARPRRSRTSSSFAPPACQPQRERRAGRRRECRRRARRPPRAPGPCRRARPRADAVTNLAAREPRDARGGAPKAGSGAPEPVSCTTTASSMPCWLRAQPAATGPPSPRVVSASKRAPAASVGADVRRRDAVAAEGRVEIAQPRLGGVGRNERQGEAAGERDHAASVPRAGRGRFLPGRSSHPCHQT